MFVAWSATLSKFRAMESASSACTAVSGLLCIQRESSENASLFIRSTSSSPSSTCFASSVSPSINERKASRTMERTLPKRMVDVDQSSIAFCNVTTPKSDHPVQPVLPNEQAKAVAKAVTVCRVAVGGWLFAGGHERGAVG